MAEPFKNLINPATVAAMAQHLGRTGAHFDRDAFVAHALPDLESLEFKARAMQLADALEPSPAAAPRPRSSRAGACNGRPASSGR